jgi:hypothetical protein
MPTSPATPARLFVTLPVDACRHLVVEIRPGGDGESDMVISHFENARQLASWGDRSKCPPPRRRGSLRSPRGSGGRSLRTLHHDASRFFPDNWR